MSYSEFPNTNYYDSDLKELICMYKKLLGEYETLVNGFEELKNQVNNFYMYVDEEISKALDKVIQELNIRMESLENEMSILTSRIEVFETDVNNRFEIERQRTDINISAIKSELLGELSDLALEFSEEIEKLRKEISEIELTMGKIYNPTSAKQDTIENTIFEVWQAARVHALTASQYDALCITASDYDNKRLTANTYAVAAQLKLRPLMVYNPYTGNIDNLQNAINTAAIMGETNPITAEEYANLHLSADAFKAFDVTSQQYDFYAKSYLILT